MTDEHAMKVAEKAYSAGNLVTCDGYYEFDLDAAAAVIAADRAGLVARIEELEGELRQIYVDATEQHADWCNMGPVDDEARDWAFDIAVHARAALKDTNA